MKLVFTRGADRDLEMIGDYIATDNPVRAESFVCELRETCSELLEFPRRYPAQAGGLRKRSVGNYLILYRVGRTRVSIVSIRHAARQR